ncbi:MAG: type II secretion system protein J [Candidatus Altimarinota bacterium]
MKNNNFAFTLIEILVGVSISVIIMISVGVFVTSGIKNITIQKSILNQESEYISLFDDLDDIFSNNFDIISSSNTGLFVKTEGFKFGKPLLYDFGIKTLTGVCENDSEIPVKYLEFKNYNPFILSSGPFSGSYLRHEIYSSIGGKIAGMGFFGDNFTNEMLGSGVFLNNPGGLSRDGGLKTFFSDTGNNRVLYYSGSRVYLLGDIEYGLYQPTGLLYNAGELFILNSGKNELWKISSKVGVPKEIDLVGNMLKNISFDRISLGMSDNFDISGSYETGSFIFSGFSPNVGDSVSSSSSEIIYAFSGAKSLSSGDVYGIKIPTFTGNFNSYGTSYVDVKFYAETTLVYQKIFPYVVNSDTNIFTLIDNDIKIFTGGLDGYYTDISLQGANVLLKDYVHKKQLVLTQNGALVSSGTLSTLPTFETTTKMYDIKVKDMQINNSGGIMTFKLDYYKNFDCYNPDANIVRTFLFKKAIPH